MVAFQCMVSERFGENFLRSDTIGTLVFENVVKNIRSNSNHVITNWIPDLYVCTILRDGLRYYSDIAPSRMRINDGFAINGGCSFLTNV